MIRLSATKAELIVVENEVVTSGAQRVFACVFALSEDWDGLDRTAVFRAGTRSVSVLLGSDNAAVVPWEVLQTPGITLHIGLYGAGPDGLVLPTVWAEIGMIRPGAYPGGDALPPTPGAYDQLVEIAENAEKIAQSVRDDADKGAFDGEPGPAGPQGPQGEPGRDGVQIDDAAVSSTETWSSRKIIDTLCPAFSAEGNPVVCTPVEASARRDRVARAGASGRGRAVAGEYPPDFRAGRGERHTLREKSARYGAGCTGWKGIWADNFYRRGSCQNRRHAKQRGDRRKDVHVQCHKAGQPEIQGKGLQIAAFGD
ncbi:MAG: hypothetical protein ACLT3G_11795, partial [Acutalibacteraceae bacterium]